MIRMHPQSKRMRLADLTPAEYNPRTISAEAMAGLSASMERFGLVQPIIWNRRTERVVGGHQRLKVLEGLGHGVPGDDKLRQIVLSFFEKLTNFSEAGNQPRIQDISDRDTTLNSLFRQLLSSVNIALDHCLTQLFQIHHNTSFL